jgi:hypothetical protein
MLTNTMPSGNRSRRWKTRAFLLVLLLLPVYVLPSFCQMFVAGQPATLLVACLSQALICLVLVFLCNSPALAIGFFAGGILLEAGMLWSGMPRWIAIWFGNAVPTGAVLYFARQCYRNMGE